jgi:hypothetical protein
MNYQRSTKNVPPFAKNAKGRPPSFYHSFAKYFSDILTSAMFGKASKGAPPAA